MKAKKNLSYAFQFHQNDNKMINSPDTDQMQMIEIDGKTKIYISLTASANEARSRYSRYLRSKRIKH